MGQHIPVGLLVRAILEYMCAKYCSTDGSRFYFDPCACYFGWEPFVLLFICQAF